MSMKDIECYQERARHERAAKRSSADPVTASAHKLLALEYEDLVAMMSATKGSQEATHNELPGQT
jgi:hypothetical protein